MGADIRDLQMGYLRSEDGEGEDLEMDEAEELKDDGMARGVFSCMSLNQVDGSRC